MFMMTRQTAATGSRPTPAQATHPLHFAKHVLPNWGVFSSRQRRCTGGELTFSMWYAQSLIKLDCELLYSCKLCKHPLHPSQTMESAGVISTKDHARKHKNLLLDGTFLSLACTHVHIPPFPSEEKGRGGNKNWKRILKIKSFQEISILFMNTAHTEVKVGNA